MSNHTPGPWRAMKPLTDLERRIIRHQLRRYPLPAGVSVFRYLRSILSNRLDKS